MYTNLDGEYIMEASDLAPPVSAANNDTGISSGNDYQTNAIPYVAPVAPVVANLDFTAQPTPANIAPATSGDSWIHEIENGLNSIGQLANATRTTVSNVQTALKPVPVKVVSTTPTVSKMTVYLSLAAAGIVLYYLARGSRATA